MKLENGHKTKKVAIENRADGDHKMRKEEADGDHKMKNKKTYLKAVTQEK